MIKRLPIIPTIVVVTAAAVMVWLGFWQLGRAEEKAALIEQYEAGTISQDLVPFPTSGDGSEVWFRRSEVECVNGRETEAVAGTSAKGAKGWAYRTECETLDGNVITIDHGFSRDLRRDMIGPGRTVGMIAPGPRLISESPPVPAMHGDEGLEPLAKPDPNDLPNNHLAYAGQWFFFALTALIIYWLAIRSRLAKRD